MKHILLVGAILLSSTLFAQKDQPIVDIRPVIQKIFQAVKKGNPDGIMSLRLNKTEVVEFQKLLNENKGKGMDEEINKLLKEIDGLVANFQEFDARQLEDLTSSYSKLLKFAEENGFSWKNANYLFETYEMRKRGPFHVEAKVVLNTTVPMKTGFDQRIGIQFEVVLIGDRWALIEGVYIDRSYGNDQWNEETAEEAVEEIDDGEY